MNYDHLWIRHNTKLNVIGLFEDYIPYSHNYFSQKTHIPQAKALVADLKSRSCGVEDIYLMLQEERQKLEGEKGDFKLRLDYAVNTLERENPHLKVAGSLGQAAKAVGGLFGSWFA